MNDAVTTTSRHDPPRLERAEGPAEGVPEVHDGPAEPERAGRERLDSITGRAIHGQRHSLGLPDHALRITGLRRDRQLMPPRHPHERCEPEPTDRAGWVSG